MSLRTKVYLLQMKKYFVKTPWLVKKLWPSYVWHIDTKEKILYLSFDDGPHPEVTPFVLEALKKYNAKASFFCIGKNVVAFPGLYQQILSEGHAAGNHTQDHLNGWKTKNGVYLKNVMQAAIHIDSALFRPPYGRIKSSQARNIAGALQKKNAKIIMWTVLSGDFDTTISSEKCLQNVIGSAHPGAIIVFHDSAKAFTRLQYTLPRVLEFFSERGYLFEGISMPLAGKI